MGVKVTIKGGTLEEVLKGKACEAINDKLAEVWAEVVPLTPVGKSIRGRTERNKLVRAGKARTRKGYTGGNLRKHWFVKPAEKQGDIIEGRLYNNTFYAPHVNYGHRTRFGMKIEPITAENSNKKRYVEGRYFLERALQKCGFKIKRKWNGDY